MEKLYTIRGNKSQGEPDRYIQMGEAGNPIIRTRTGYKADDVILFENKESAYKFLVDFISDRKRSDIKWDVVEYNPSRASNSLVGLIAPELFGRQGGSTSPGEVIVDFYGKVYRKFFKSEIVKFTDSKKSHIIYIRGKYRK